MIGDRLAVGRDSAAGERGNRSRRFGHEPPVPSRVEEQRKEQTVEFAYVKAIVQERVERPKREGTRATGSRVAHAFAATKANAASVITPSMRR